MPTYVFENMTADQAASFASGDRLNFATATLQPSDVIAAASGSLIDLSAVGRNLNFPAVAFAGNSNIEFALG